MRMPAPKTKRRVSLPKSFPAPRRGWISNENLAAPKSEGAAVLENWFPTPTGIRMRRGSQKYATIGSGNPVTSMAIYNSGNNARFFATNSTDLYDLTTVVDPDVSPTPSYSGMTGGDWSWLQFETAGGEFLIGVNGEDDGLIFNGVDWYPVTDSNLYRLDYDAQTVEWGATGLTVTGGTSGATGVIYRISDSGTTGYLWINAVTGTFQDNEIITASTGSATVNGVAVLLTPGVTGIAMSSLSYLASHRSRVWAIEKESLNAWYFDVEAISGAAHKFPLGGVFERGGSLLFIAEWSRDEGAGLQASLAFFTTEGEVAVYGGIDPSDSAAWSLKGVYRVGLPLGKDAWVKAGGDILIATDIGLIPISQAVDKDIGALTMIAVSQPIQDEWTLAVGARISRPWAVESWPTKQMLLVAFPPADGHPEGMFVVNMLTGAWAPFTAWNGTTLQLFGSRLFWGTEDGTVVEAEVTGADQGAPYVCSCVPLFDDLKAPAALKIQSLARAVYRSPTAANLALTAKFDFDTVLPAAPDVSPVIDGDTWGTGIWGQAVWAESYQKSTFGGWQSVGGQGYAMSIGLQITSGGIAPPDLDLVRIDTMYEIGDLVS